MSTTPTTAAAPPAFISATCGAVTLADKEGYAVKFHTDGTVIINSAQGEFCLPLVTAGVVGKAVAVAVPGSVVPVCVEKAINAGVLLTSNGAGKFEAALAADYVCAIALEASSTDGDFIRALILGTAQLN